MPGASFHTAKTSSQITPEILMIENQEAFNALSLIFEHIYRLLMSVTGSDVCRLLTLPKVIRLWLVETVS